MTRFCLSALVLLALAAPAAAQTVPGPRVNLAFDQPQASSCESPTVLNAWNFTYGSCYRPAGVNLGDPWISHVRVTFTGTTTVSTLVPRAQITLETTAARCNGVVNGGACLRISDLAAPVGNSTVTIRFVTAEGTEGGPSNGLPFVGTSPTVPAATGLR
jgi:hypothetical protein